MKRIICILLTILLLTGISACGGQANKTGDNQTTASTESKVTETKSSETKDSEMIAFPLKDKVKLSMLTSVATSAVQPSPDLPVYKEIVKATNVELNIEAIPVEGYNEALNTRLAAGVDMPDIVLLQSSDKVFKLIEDKMIIPMDDLLKKSGDGLNLLKYLNESPVDKAQYVFPDGQMYQIGNYMNPSHMIYGLNVNRKILREKGITKDPQTIDEFYDMLVKLKAGGVKTPLSSMWGMYMHLSHAFGLHITTTGVMGSSGYWAYDGKVQNDYMNLRMKEFYVWMNKLYKEGLLDPEFNTMTWDNLMIKITKGDVAALTIWNGCGWAFNEASKIKDEAGWDVVAPLKGPYGDSYNIKNYSATVPDWGHVITKTCKNPEVAAALLAWAKTSQKHFDLYFWGIEGLNYNIENGKKVRPKDYSQDALMKTGAGGGILLPFGQWWPGLYDIWPQSTFADKLLAEHDGTDEIQKSFIDPFPKNSLLPEELAIYNKYGPDIATYIKEMEIRFITGKDSLDKWDAYIAKLKEMGIDELININQARYDRFLKIIGK